ncbi:50S ribosomal protein L23 [Candidatus Giovannonibacteria bacterium RIFCSPLOWO2_01_FULL_46_13]|uniref:Large ribosomal subunit protein uL23 n=1 Tax=Candidatus Giovannonibacteria bacterium RIFCSPLOWO2_01_FULL_46_13 TaxID=1798352 RepID=A0A1F5X5G2_9BACT|nr:MAG: 50S ribosomal protein L23 [Candidatus Giovannonibacteria bacterium RIFCSPLOWO2_01_FULL_46_13]
MSKITHPIITEKANMLAAEGVYAFRVEKNANKFEIKKAVEGMYKVNVTRVNLVSVHPKRRVLRGRTGFKQGYKKALVSLKKGQKIELA